MDQARAALTPGEVAGRIQHTNVRPGATQGDIERLLAECLEYGFDGAMVNPIWVPLAAEILAGSAVKVCTALDFPMGGHTVASVVRSAAEAVGAGAHQVDVMTKVGWLRSGMDAEYTDHLASVVQAVAEVPVKAMLEAALLTADELARAVECCARAGISYLKNSSGFDGAVASPDIVRTLVRLAAGRMKVKASGGIRSFAQARSLLWVGAVLLGSSAGVAIAAGGDAAGPDRY
jgi:deoxyribose-phosphate aldolase